MTQDASVKANEVANIPPKQDLTKTAAPKPNLTVGGPVRGLIPQTIEEAARLAAAMTASIMVPESIQGTTAEETRSRCLMVILSGMELGVPPMAAMTGFYIVNNRVTIYGDVALATVQASEKYESHHETIVGKEGTPEWTAICTIKRRGVDEPFVRKFSWADAKTAGLIGKRGPWTNYPQRQLQMRARSWALRDGFSDVLKGMGIAEEVGDIPQKEVVKQDISTQADDFAVKAIGAPVPEAPKTTVQEPPASDEPTPPTAELPDAGPIPAPQKPVCPKCQGRGVIEDETGKGPCPVCHGLPL